jgi:ComF family protein
LALAPGLIFCSDCAGSAPPERPPWLLHECVARVDYVYPWSDLIAQFKFQQKPAWAHHLAKMLTDDEAVMRVLGTCEVLAPIPLTPSGLVTRGYNQSWELLKAVTGGKRMDWAPCHNLLMRTDMATQQHRLSRSERLTNQQLRFAVPSHLRKRILNRHVLLVDDVLTTGATLNAAASALLDAGADRVSGLVFARTPVNFRNG